MPGQPRKQVKLVGRSETLPSLRKFVELQDELKRFIGPIASYAVVVDANILIRDLLWLSKKRKNPNAKTELLECLVAETLVAHVSTTVVVEVEREMACLAAERGIPTEVWRSHWAAYTPLLRVEEPDPVTIAKYASGRDPTDASTLALADIRAVCGILTHDPDIKAMGGKVVPIRFKLDVRDYSRQAAVFVSLQIGGCYVAVGAVEALAYAVKALGRALNAFRALPGWVKIVAMLAVAAAFLHPTSRKAIIDALKAFGAAVKETFPGIMAFLLEVVQIFEEQRVVPPLVTHL